MTRCRHNKTWLLAGAHIEWCYGCGAIRQMSPHKTQNSTSPAVSKEGRKARFIRPVGKGGDNPYEKLVS